MRQILFYSFFLLVLNAGSQTLPPYHQSFEQNALGWRAKHSEPENLWKIIDKNFDTYAEVHDGNRAYAIYFPTPNLTARNSYLESPVFDLTDMPEDLYLSFWFKYTYYTSHNKGSLFSVEYKIGDKGWRLLYNAIDEPFNWPVWPYKNSSGRTVVYTGKGVDPETGYKFCAHNLKFLEGNNNVKFRISLVTPGGYEETFLIDDFSIDVAKSNLKVLKEDESINIVSKGEKFQVKFPVRISGFRNDETEFEIDYYLSEDSILDASDLFIERAETHTYYSGIMNLGVSTDGQISLPKSVDEGLYYVIYKVLPKVGFNEVNYSDNIGFIRLNFISRMPYPHYNKVVSDKSFLFNADNINGSDWVKGNPVRKMVNYAPSDSICWYQQPNNNGSWSNKSGQIKSYAFNMPDNDSKHVFSFWYLNNTDDFIWYLYQNNSLLKSVKLPLTEKYKWRFISIDISEFKGFTNVYYAFNTYSNSYQVAGNAFDEIYIGEALPDLLLTSQKKLYVDSLNAIDTFYCEITNAGSKNAASFKTKFYYSTNSIFDDQDILINETYFDGLLADSSLCYQFPIDLPNTFTPFYVYYVIDSEQDVVEMWEGNNDGVIKIRGSALVQKEYANSFETGFNDWTIEEPWIKSGITIANSEKYIHESKNNVWADSSILFTVNEGAAILSNLYTPIFNVQGLKQPVVLFDYEGNGESFIDLEYSVNGGAVWEPIKNLGGSNETRLTTDREKFRNYRRSYDLAELSNKRIRFRFQINGFSQDHRCLIDNFKIKDALEKPTVFYTNLSNGSTAGEFEFDMELRNYEPIKVDSLHVSCFLSNDSVFSSTDSVLYTTLYTDFEPGSKIQHSKSFTINTTGTQKFIIVTLALKNGQITDTAWHAISDYRVNKYPYIESFNSKQSSQLWTSTSTVQTHRLRLVSANNDLDKTDRWETDFLPYWADPELTLESPVFDLTELSKVYLQFQLRSRGGVSGSSTGGYLKYSLNAGKTWKTLGYKNDKYGYGWYNETMYTSLGSIPAWMDWDDFYNRVYDASSVLSGKDSVKFKYYFNPLTDGNIFREIVFDNFIIDSVRPEFSIKAIGKPEQILKRTGYDYIAEFDIVNCGNMLPGNYAIRYYFSHDSILDAGDTRVVHIDGPEISPGDTLHVASSFGYIECVDEAYIICNIEYINENNTQLPIIKEQKYAVSRINFNGDPVKILEATSDTVYWCSDDKMMLSVEDDDFYSYTWSDGTTDSFINISEEGLYSVDVTNRYGCFVGSDAVNVKFFRDTSRNLVFDLSANADTVYLIEPQGNIVEWSSGEMQSAIVNDKKGYYYYYFYNENGCKNRSFPAYNLYKAGTDQTRISYTDSLFCEGDSVKIRAQLANSYLWANTDTTFYTFVKTTSSNFAKLTYANSTVNTDTVDINSVHFPSSKLRFLNDSICFGDTMHLSAELNTNYTYKWNIDSTRHEIVVDREGEYSAEITNRNMCTTKSELINIGYFPDPVKPIIAQKGFRLYPLNQSAGHIWLFNDDTVAVNLATGFEPPQNGNYSLISINEFGCSSKSNYYNYTSPNDSLGLIVAPNPFSTESKLLVALNEKAKLSVDVYTTSGTTISIVNDTFEAGNYYFNINANEFKIPRGINVLVIKINDRRMGSKQIIRQ